jgi:hypothetical protein
MQLSDQSAASMGCKHIDNQPSTLQKSKHFVGISLA